MPYILLEDGTSRILLEDGTSLLLMEEPATTDWSGTGSLSVTPTLSGAGVYNRTGTGSLSVTATLTADGAHGWGGTGDLAVTALLSGSGTAQTPTADYPGDGALIVAATIVADASTSAAPEATVDPGGGGGAGRPRRRRLIKLDDEERLADELAWVHHVLRGEIPNDEPKPTPRKIVRRLRQAATHVEKAAREGSVAPAQTVERVAALKAATEVALEQPDWGAYIDALLWTRALLDRLMAEAAEMDDEEALLLLL